MFQNGDAAFALNWTYMYNLANAGEDSAVASKVGVVAAPGVAGVSEHSAVNGSMGLGITSTSEHPDEAWDYIVHMTSQPVQNAYAKLSLPIWASSYTDPAVTSGQEELIEAAGQGLAVMYPRPMTPNYKEMSMAVQQGLQEALRGWPRPPLRLRARLKAAVSKPPSGYGKGRGRMGLARSIREILCSPTALPCGPGCLSCRSLL